MIEITPVKTKAECVSVQNVFNHPDIIGYLGGFCILDTLVGKMKQSGCTIWKAEFEGEVVGGYLTAGRSQCHQAKFGEVSVLPEYRRKRIGTCLYAAGIFQSVIEGRRLMEDTIVGDNPFQFNALKSLRIPQVGVLPMKTASFKDIVLFCLNLDVSSLKHVFSRLPCFGSESLGVEIYVEKSYYTEDLWEKNINIYTKKRPEFITEINYMRDMIISDGRVSVLQGPKQPKQARKRSSEKQERFI